MTPEAQLANYIDVSLQKRTKLELVPPIGALAAGNTDSTLPRHSNFSSEVNETLRAKLANDANFREWVLFGVTHNDLDEWPEDRFGMLVIPLLRDA